MKTHKIITAGVENIISDTKAIEIMGAEEYYFFSKDSEKFSRTSWVQDDVEIFFTN